MRLALLASPAALLIPSVVLADQPSAPVIVVTGQGLKASELLSAYAVQDIPRERTDLAASGRLEDALSAAAGVQQFRRSDSRSANPSAQGVTLRGLGGNATSRTLVLLDAVPVSDPFFGHVPFTALPFERLGGIRVIRGGGAGAFGAGAVAGTIALSSANPAELDPLEASLAINDRGESELSASAVPRLGDGYAVASVRWDRGQGFWTTPVSQRVAASTRARFESWSTSLRAVVPVGEDLELQARALVYDDRRTLRFTGADSSSSGEDASIRLVGRGAWQFDALAYVQARDFTNVVISATSFRKTLDQRATPATGLGGKIELRPPLPDGQALRLGMDWRRASGEAIEDAYSTATGRVTARRRAGGRNDDLGFYVEHDRALGPLRLTASGRLDRWVVGDGYSCEAPVTVVISSACRTQGRSGWTASLRGGALVDLARGITLRGSAYSGMRQPTLNELYRSFVVFPVTTRANPDLANETLRGFEAGLDLEPAPGLALHLTAFDNRVRDAIANVTIAPSLRQRRNVDAVHARGLELGASAKLGTLSWDASLALTRARVEASGIALALDGKRPAQVPGIAASTSLAWRPAEGWLVAATLRHTGAQYEDDLQVDRLPAATTLDAVAHVPLSHGLTLVLRAENVTDARVITRNQAGSLDMGAPRTLWAGIRVVIPR